MHVCKCVRETMDLERVIHIQCVSDTDGEQMEWSGEKGGGGEGVCLRCVYLKVVGGGKATKICLGTAKMSRCLTCF